MTDDSTRLIEQGARKELKHLLSRCASIEEKVDVLSKEFVARSVQAKRATNIESKLTDELTELREDKRKLELRVAEAQRRETILRELVDKLNSQRTMLEAEMKKSEDRHREHSKDLVARFEGTLGDIKRKIAEDSSRGDILARENQILEATVKQRDAHVELLKAQARQYELETKAALAKLQDVMTLAAKEKERGDAHAADADRARAELREYTTRFKQLQDTMGESQRAMQSVHVEMRKNMALIEKLTKEKAEADKRAAKSDLALVEMHKSLAEARDQAAASQKRADTLLLLCKRLEQELRAARGESAAPAPASAPAPTSGSEDAAPAAPAVAAE